MRVGRCHAPCATVNSESMNRDLQIAGRKPKEFARNVDVNEVRLIERIRCGEEAAFEQVFRTYFQVLADFAWRQTGEREVAEEIVQDVFFSIWRRGENWNPPLSLKAYLYGATRNMVIKHIKHQEVVRRWARNYRATGYTSDAGPEEDLIAGRLARDVERAISELPERRRMIYVLSRTHGLSNAEIAAALNISISTVEVQMWHALSTLRRRLAVYLEKD